MEKGNHLYLRNITDCICNNRFQGKALTCFSYILKLNRIIYCIRYITNISMMKKFIYFPRINKQCSLF
jgi:uncharacterized MAPEG superfamily protein